MQHIVMRLLSLSCLGIALSFSNQRSMKQSTISCNSMSNNNNDMIPKTRSMREYNNLKRLTSIFTAISIAASSLSKPSLAVEPITTPPTTTAIIEAEADVAAPVVDIATLKLPYFRENLEFKEFLGKRATMLFNMKIDDPQTVNQFPELAEIFRTYRNQGLNVHAFPTEQGWFEPDDDETCRLKAKEYYSFGDVYPNSVVFDKVWGIHYYIIYIYLIYTINYHIFCSYAILNINKYIPFL